MQWMKPRQPETTGLVLRADGRAQVFDVQQATQTVDSQRYVADTARKVWVEQAIPPGHLYVYLEGNPEPVHATPPKGYGASTLEALMGPWLATMFRDATHEPTLKLGWERLALIALAGLGGVTMLYLAGSKFHWW